MISPVNAWVENKTRLYGNLTASNLEKWQKDKLREAIEYAEINTRFYRKKIDASMALADLPFTLPADIANDPYAFLAIPQNRVARVATLANSGTTTLKKRIFFSESDLERTKDFFSVGMSTIVNKGERVQILISNKTENSLGTLLKQSLERINVSAEISGAIRSVNNAIEISRDADCLVGMPAELLYMSHVAPSLRPRSVLLAADTAPRAVIERIIEKWKCNLFTHYGHSEFGYGLAVDCHKHHGLHLRDADNIIEIIDIRSQKPALPGHTGEIVITTLSNEAMPLIRYKTGNISRLLTDPCKCGSKLHRLGNIEGRISDIISISHDNTIAIHQLDEILFANRSVLGFDASVSCEKDNIILHLTIDSTRIINPGILKSLLPGNAKIDIKYGTTDPFRNRRKRRLTEVSGR